jgi:hypothetical protein
MECFAFFEVLHYSELKANRRTVLRVCRLSHCGSKQTNERRTSAFRDIVMCELRCFMVRAAAGGRQNTIHTTASAVFRLFRGKIFDSPTAW